MFKVIKNFNLSLITFLLFVNYVEAKELYSCTGDKHTLELQVNSDFIQIGNWIFNDIKKKNNHVTGIKLGPVKSRDPYWELKFIDNYELYLKAKLPASSNYNYIQGRTSFYYKCIFINNLEEKPVIESTQPEPKIESSQPKETINLDIYEKKCSEIGYTKGTEKFGECVLKLFELNNSG